MLLFISIKKSLKCKGYIMYQDLFLYHIPNTPFSELSVLFCGREKASPEKKLENNILTHFSLHYVLEGKGKYIINNKEFSVNKGDIFVYFPNVITSFYPQSETFIVMFIDFIGSKVSEILARSLLTTENPYYSYKDNKILNLFNKIISLNKLYYSKDLACVGCLCEIFAHIINEKKVCANSSTRDNIDDHINNALAYIDKNYNNKDLNAKDVSKYLNINKDYFSRLFKQRMNKTFTDYVTNYRTSKACYLMETTTLTISQISEAVGFNTPYYFSKIFKQTKGATPKDYRKNAQKYLLQN